MCVQLQRLLLWRQVRHLRAARRLRTGAQRLHGVCLIVHGRLQVLENVGLELGDADRCVTFKQLVRALEGDDAGDDESDRDDASADGESPRGGDDGGGGKFDGVRAMGARHTHAEGRGGNGGAKGRDLGSSMPAQVPSAMTALRGPSGGAGTRHAAHSATGSDDSGEHEPSRILANHPQSGADPQRQLSIQLSLPDTVDSGIPAPPKARSSRQRGAVGAALAMKPFANPAFADAGESYDVNAGLQVDGGDETSLVDTEHAHNTAFAQTRVTTNAAFSDELSSVRVDGGAASRAEAGDSSRARAMLAADACTCCHSQLCRCSHTGTVLHIARMLCKSSFQQELACPASHRA